MSIKQALKCNDCNSVFTDPMDTNECSICNSFCVPVQQCEVCGEYFEEDEEFYKGYCFECAKNKFNIELGLKYLKDNDLEKDFFIGWCFQSEFIHVNDSLVTIARDSFMKSYLIESSANITVSFDKMKNWITDDITDWINYLVGEDD